MSTLTKRELLYMGAIIQDDAAFLNGSVYYHESNDYQAGAGNHDDYRLFREVELIDRDPLYGGVQYFSTDSNKFVIKIEYPTNLLESQALSLIDNGIHHAKKHGVYIYLFGSNVPL